MNYPDSFNPLELNMADQFTQFGIGQKPLIEVPNDYGAGPDPDESYAGELSRWSRSGRQSEPHHETHD